MMAVGAGSAADPFLGVLNQIVKGQLQGLFVVALSQFLQLLCGSVKLSQQLIHEAGITCHHWLLFTPFTPDCLVWKSFAGGWLHRQKTVEAVKEKAEMMAIQLGQQRGINPCDRISIDHRQASRGVMRKPQAWPPSSRQCTLSTVQS